MDILPVLCFIQFLNAFWGCKYISICTARELFAYASDTEQYNSVQKHKCNDALKREVGLTLGLASHMRHRLCYMSTCWFKVLWQGLSKWQMSICIARFRETVTHLMLSCL